ncbi:PD-(D/E)XK nuclease family protein [Fodinibacter luteus]|uniref:PD-(D/E)XK nuclease family protein n=1 Tax=Fodinibacter luteus TaxID=552064 RepID=UPI0031EA50B1
MTGEIRWVRYGPEALQALRGVVAEAKADDAMAPVTVLVPNNIAGIVARRFLAHGLGPDRRGIAAIRFTTLRHIAEQLAAPTFAGASRRPATSAVTAAAVRACLDTDPGTFAPVAAHPATARALARSHRALRDVDPEALPHLVRVSSLTADVVRLHQATRDRLIDGFYDTTDLLHTATNLLGSGAASTDELGTLVLYLPQDLDRAETWMLRALAAAAPGLHVVAALTATERPDAAVVAAVAAVTATQDRDTDRAHDGDREPHTPAREEPTAHRVLTASDADDEVRCAVREVVAALREHPAHRLAVLYANVSPYARLLHEHLAAAGITVNGAGVRPVAERATARLLLGLLENARTGFRRGDVMRTLGEVPLTTFTGARVSVARFERVSREAGVIGGEDWQAKLEAYVERQEHEAATTDYESSRAHARRNVEAGEQLLTFVTDLQRSLDDAARTSTWHALGRAMLDLLDAVLTEDRRRRLPLEEQYALGVVERVLTGLTALDTQGLAPSLLGLEEVLGVELESALPRVGRFGEGVLVAPLSQAVGLDLDEVWVVGLSEDLYPGRLHEDSLLPERVRAASAGQLPSTRTTLDTKHRQLLAAFDTAPRVTASFPRGDLRRSSERLPSRWLLPSLRALSGNPNLAATRWADGVGASQAWLHSSPSFAASVLDTDEPSTRQEWAMRAASATHDLEDDAVAAARELQRARESNEFTRFDGNLTGSEGLTDFATGERLVSPTSLERYAICPHAWFVQRMLHVEPVESPEEAIEINALDVGNIVHESFDQLVTEATERGELPGYGQPWSDAQRRRLQEIGAATADRFESEGLTGHPRLWPVARLRLLTTLDRMVTDDNEWRRGSAPGWSPASWPSASTAPSRSASTFRMPGASPSTVPPTRSTRPATEPSSSRTSRPAAPARSAA